MSSAMRPEPSGERSALSVRSLSGEPQTPDQIEAEIEVQRERLAETIDALSAKLDVKSQAQARVEEAKQTAQSKVEHVLTTAHAVVGSAQSKIGSTPGAVAHTVKTGTVTPSGRPRPEVLAFGITVLLATAVLWWRER